MKKINTISGHAVLVDDADYEWLNQFKWEAAHFGSRTLYAYTRTSGRKNRKGTMMHRLILGATEEAIVDHSDRNGLNNQRKNLRICTRAQNVYNSGISKNNTSGYKGVYWHGQRQKWASGITIDRKFKSLGLFFSKEEAALAYNKAAKTFFKEFAYLNDVTTYKLDEPEHE